MHENGITAAFNALGDKINRLECELTIERSVSKNLEEQKMKLEAELAHAHVRIEEQLKIIEEMRTQRHE